MKDRSKILYITSARLPTQKAHGVTISKGCEAFARAGAEVVLVTPRRINKEGGDIFSFYNLERNFDVVRLPTLDLYHVPGIPKMVAFFVHQVVYHFFVKAYCLFKSRDWVIYTRDSLTLWLSCLGFSTFFEVHHVPKRSSFFYISNRRAKGVVSISSSIRDMYRDHGFTDDQVLIASSGVDMGSFDVDVTKEIAREKLSIDSSKKVIGYFGRFKTMGKSKGVDTTIEILKDLPKDVLFLASGGSDEDVAEYQKLAESLGVADRVMLYGFAPQKEQGVRQKACDVLVMPFPRTPHYENHMSPVKMFEYMASKRPIVSSDLRTVRDVLNEDIAYLFEPDDTDAYIKAIRDVFDDPEKARKVADAAYSKVGQYTWQSRAERVLAFTQGE